MPKVPTLVTAETIVRPLSRLIARMTKVRKADLPGGDDYREALVLQFME